MTRASELVDKEFSQWSMRHSRSPYSEVKVNVIRRPVLSLWMTIEYKDRNFDFVIEYDNGYPRTPINFYGNWSGTCDSQIFCFWLSEVKSRQTKTVTDTLQTCVVEMKAIVDTYNKNQNIVKMLDKGEEVEEYLDDDEAELIEMLENAPHKKTIPSYSQLDVRDSMFLKYNNNPNIKIDEKSDILWNVLINSVNYVIDFSQISVSPIVYIKSPKFEFDGISPVKPSGLVIIEGITPKTWTGSKDIIQELIAVTKSLGKRIADEYDNTLVNSDYNLLKDQDIVNIEKETKRNRMIEESNKRLQSLKVKTNLLSEETIKRIQNNQLSRLPQGRTPFERRKLYVKEEYTKNSFQRAIQGNKVLIPINIWEQFEVLKIEIPIVELELSSGLKTYCGVSGPSYENTIIIPEIVAMNLLIKGKTNVQVFVRGVDPSLLADITFRELDSIFYKNINHDQILQESLLNYPVLTTGEYIVLGNEYTTGDAIVVSVSPSPCARTIKEGFGEIEVPFTVLAPYDYIEEYEYDPLKLSPSQLGSDYSESLSA